MDAALSRKHLNIYNLTATNANLMKLTISMHVHKKLTLLEDWGVRRRKPKTSQNDPENCFFGSISGAFQFLNFRKKIKTITYLMHCVTLHHWSKFQTNLTTFPGVKSKKLPRSSLKLYLLLVWKHLKFRNYKSDLNETWPRYVPAEYLEYNKNGQVEGGGATKKPPENALKLRGI